VIAIHHKASTHGFALITVVVFLTLIGFAFVLLSEQVAGFTARTSEQADELVLAYALQSATTHANWELANKGCSNYANLSGTIDGATYGVNFSDTGGSPLSLVLNGTLASGRERTLDRSSVRSYGSITQQDFNALDGTYIDEAKTNQTKGDDQKVQVTGNTGHDHRGLVRADLTDLPSAARIEKAELILTIQRPANNDEPILVRRLTESWDEDEASWDQRKDNTNWTVTGGTTSGVVYAQFETAGLAGASITADVTALVREWHAGVDNHGFLLSYASNDGPDIHLNSDDHSSMLLRVFHSCECGESCAVDLQVSCDANFDPNRLRANISGNDAQSAVAHVAENAQVMGVTMPAGGGFVTVDDKTLTAFDATSTTLGTCTLNTGSSIAGLTYATSGAYLGQLVAVLDHQPVEIVAIGADCAIAQSAVTSSTSLDAPSAISFVEMPDGATHQHHFLITNNSGEVTLLDESLAYVSTITPSESLGNTFGIAHIPNQTRFLISDDGSKEVITVAFDGTVEGRYDTTRLGHDDLGGLSIDVEQCDHVLAGKQNSSITAIYEQSLSTPPIAHWPLDASSGTVAEDVVGDNDGTLVLGPIWFPTFGAVQGSLDVLVPERVEVPDAPTLQLDTQVSAASWIYPYYTAGYHPILSKGAGANQNYWFGIALGRLAVIYHDGTTQAVSAGPILNTDEWHHLAFSYSTDSGALNLYLNGALVHTEAAGGTLSTSTAQLLIGASESTQYVDGHLDDVHLFGSEITATDVELLYARGEPASLGGGSSSRDVSGACVTPDTYSDQFEDADFNGSDGSLSWSEGWQEVGETDGAQAGDVRLRSGAGNQYMRLRDNNNGGEGIQRTVDLSAFSSASITFDYQRLSLASDEYIAVSVIDGGQTTELTRLTEVDGLGNDVNFLSATYSLDAFLGSSVDIQFITSTNMANTHGVHLDNITIEGCLQ